MYYNTARYFLQSVPSKDSNQGMLYVACGTSTPVKPSRVYRIWTWLTYVTAGAGRWSITFIVKGDVQPLQRITLANKPHL